MSLCFIFKFCLNRHSWVDAGRNSLADINSGGPELDSGGSSPGVQKV